MEMIKKIHTCLVLLFIIVAWAACSTIDYESECHQYQCIALTSTEVQTQKGNKYKVPEKWGLKKGEEYVVMFEIDNVTPRKVVK